MTNLKPSLIVLSLFFSVELFAQLTVRNNAYIFVDDQVLFVEDDVNIQENTANIYLRNEAQLLQGTGTTGNSGIGRLSVYQRGTVNNFNYNYWCSPVGNTSGNNNANRPFTPNNNIYDVTAAPITSSLAAYTSGYNGSSSPLVISSAWLYSYNPGGQYSDWDYIGAGGTVAAGYGFTMKGTTGSGSNQLYDFRGKPNTGEITVQVLAPVAGVPQSTLTGNPYPSALDARDFFHMDPENQAALAGTGAGALYFWEQNSSSHVLASYIGGYATYTIDSRGIVSYIPAPWATYDAAGNVTGGVGTSPNSTPGVDVPGRYLPVGQGFMVEGAANANIYFRNTYREYWKESSGDSHFFRSQDQNASEDQNVNEDTSNLLPSNYMRFRIVYDIEHNSQYFSRELLVNMADYATDDYDYGMEAKLSETFPSDAYFVCKNVPFGILAVPFYLDRKIPLVVKVHHQQNVKFRTYALQNFPDDLPVYLHDIDNNTYTNLRIQNAEVNLAAGTYTNRFEITFQSETLGVEEINDTDLMVYQNNTTSELTIKNPNSYQINKVSLYDITGKQIFDEVKLPINTEYTFSTKKLSEGTYIVKVSLENQTVSKKVIIHN